MEKENLKKLIQKTVRESLLENDKKIHMGKAYQLKEQIMKIVQDGLRANADLIESQDEYEKFVDEEIEKLRADLDLTFSMVGRALYQVPFQAFKLPKVK